MLVESSYRTSCHGEAASLVIGCAVDPTLSRGMLRLSVQDLQASRAPSGSTTQPGSAASRPSLRSLAQPGSPGTSHLIPTPAHSRRDTPWRVTSAPAHHRASLRRPRHRRRRSRSSSWHWICTSRRSSASTERVQQATAASAWRSLPRRSRAWRVASRQALTACHMSSTCASGTSLAQSSPPCSARPFRRAQPLCQQT